MRLQVRNFDDRDPSGLRVVELLRVPVRVSHPNFRGVALKQRMVEQEEALFLDHGMSLPGDWVVEVTSWNTNELRLRMRCGEFNK